MLQIIFIVVAVIGFISLSGRISRLETLAKKGRLLEERPRAEAGQEVAPATISESSVFSAMTEKASTASPQTPVAPRIIATEEEGGRWLGKIGIVALLLGVSFFLKYAFDNNLIGVVGRVILGLVSGVALLAIGQFLRTKYQRYSDILMGGGIGILYLTIYASFSFYNLISQPTAFIFLFCVTALAVVISVIDKAFQLAVMGIFGGFLTPFLISTDNNAMVALFSYVLILDIGVLAISFQEKWLKLNYLAFIGTALLFLGWFVRFYSEDQLFLTMVFLSSYFLIFLIATIAHHLIRHEVSNGSDLALVTFNAIAYFGMSYLMLNLHYHAFMGFFAVMLALLYFFLAFLSLSAGSEDKFLNLYLSGIAVLFLTLAIPIQLNGTWITLAWLIESVIIAGFSTAVPKARFHAYGPIVYAVGLIRLFSTEVFSSYNSLSPTPFFNKSFFLFVMAIIAAYILGFFYEQAREEEIIAFKPKTLAAIFLVLANLITVYSLTTEVSRMYDQKVQIEYSIQATEQKQQANYQGNYYSGYANKSDVVVSLENQRNTAVSILWALYAIILTIVGFATRSKTFRSFGLIFFFVTAFKILIDVWSLGPLYRIISSITFGVIALLGSFAYAKYKDRIKQIINE
ncbi:MAG: DUF2339 domain-containing protein [bacterium]|nr:DUF2339 domain-containing protein [bacterium]